MVIIDTTLPTKINAMTILLEYTLEEVIDALLNLDVVHDF